MSYYLCAYITLISALLGVGFSIGAIMQKKNESRTNALYMLARSLALACIAVIPIFTAAPKVLLIITTAMLIVQLADGFIGILIKSKMRTLGPFLMAALHAVCLIFGR